MRKRIFILIVGIFMLIALLSFNVNRFDCDEYITNYDEIGLTLTKYITKDVTLKETLESLDDFEAYIKKAVTHENAEELHLKAIKLFKEGLTENDSDKISDAAYLNYEAYKLLIDAK